MFRRGFRSTAHSLPLVLALCLCLTLTAAAEGTRISRAYTTDGFIVSAQVSARGDYAVYETFKPIDSSDGTPNLYSVPLAGGAPVSLTAPLPIAMKGGFDTLRYAVSPTGERVVFQACQDEVNVISLYSIPIEGGDAVRLSHPGHQTGPFVEPALSPDGQYVVFVSWYNNQYRLFRANLDGAMDSAVEITPHGATNFQVSRIQISPDSQHILFTANFQPEGTWGVFRIPAGGDGSSYTRLSLPDQFNSATEFQITPDSQRVIYLHRLKDANNVFTYRLQAVPISGPKEESKLVSGEGGVNGAYIRQFMVSPNSRYLVFIADRETYGKSELFSVDLSQETFSVLKLNMALRNDQGVDYGFAISPDSTRVVYNAYWTNVHDLFSVKINGPINTNVKINNPVESEPYSGWSYKYVFSPDSSRIVFTAMHTEDYVELFSVPANGPADEAVKLNPPLALNPYGYAMINLFVIAPDGGSVVYAAPSTGNKYILYQVPLNGPVEKNVPLIAASGALNWFRTTPDSTRAVYIAGETGFDDEELFMTTAKKFQWKTYLPGVRR